jgi:hypothetical protein
MLERQYIMTYKFIIIIFILTSNFAFGQSYRFKTIDSSYVFDKAKYHLESVESDRLSDTHAFVHTAFFIVWCIEKELINEKFKRQFVNQIKKVKSRQISPTTIYQDMDGVFIGGILTLEGYNFAMKYFHFSNGNYLKDYEKLKYLTRKNQSIYGVEDTWSNYEIVKELLDKKYAKWK